MNEKTTKTIRDRLTPLNPADLAIVWGETEVANSGLGPGNPVVQSHVETYLTRTEASLRAFDFAAIRGHLVGLRNGLRTAAAAPRDELSELATRQAEYRNAALRGYDSKEIEAITGVAALSPGETFAEFLWDRITTSRGRSLSRAELRAKARPAGFERKKWDSIWAPIVKPQDVRE